MRTDVIVIVALDPERDEFERQRAPAQVKDPGASWSSTTRQPDWFSYAFAGSTGDRLQMRARLSGRWRAGDLEAAWTLAQEGLPHPHAHAVLAAFSRSHGGDIPEGPLTDDPAVADIVARARRRVTTT